MPKAKSTIIKILNHVKQSTNRERPYCKTVR